MDQGLKERLVGAAVLVAIGVWLIPWVLDGPDNPIENSSSYLQLPAAEEPVPMRTQTLRIGGQSEPPAVSAATTEPQPSISALPPAPAEPAETAPSEPASAPVPAAVAEVKPPTPGAAALAPSAVAPAPAVVPAPPAAPASTPRTAPQAAVPAAAAKGDWVVQLGSFGAEDNARKLSERATQLGYKATVSSIRANGRTLYRVRVGPYETRRAADAAASALGGQGVKGQVVAAD